METIAEKLAELDRRAERAAASRPPESVHFWYTEPVESIYNQRHWTCEVCDNFDWRSADGDTVCQVCGNTEPTILLA